MRRRIEVRAFSHLAWIALIWIALIWITALVLSGIGAAQEIGNSQSAQAPSADPSTSPPVFHVSSRLLLLDVIVTDHNGHFIAGLKARDFTVLEDNKPQKLSAFGTAVAASTASAPTAPLQLPPHQYANFSFAKQSIDRPVTVVLMDMLNTSGIDQAYGRKQMIRFLETLPQGQQVALFVLTSKLKMIQGFTGDSATLVAAAQAVLRNQSLFTSPEAQQQQEEDVTTAIESTAGPSFTGPGGTASTAALAPIGQALRNAMAAQDSFQKLERMGITLNALDSLAGAVAGYPGRKNLIWLSAEFPVTFDPGFSPYAAEVNLQTGKNATNNQLRDLENDSPPLHQTAALLAAVRLAIYPIDVRGMVSLGTGIDISAQTSYLGAVDMQNEVTVSGRRQTTALWDAHEAMSDIARETGGRAFYGTNDLKDAMSRSVQEGSSYYTLAYSPSNRAWNGKYRKIQVKTTNPGAELTYRRGYYALQETKMGGNRAALAMTAAMQPSMPQFTGLLLKVQILPPDQDHQKTRIDYAVDAHDIKFTDSADQRKRASIDFVAIAWDKDFQQVARVAAGMDTTIRSEPYQQVLQTGLPFHQEIDLKPGTYTLRLGVLDRGSRRIGSIQTSLIIPALTIPDLTIPEKKPVVSRKPQ